MSYTRGTVLDKLPVTPARADVRFLPDRALSGRRIVKAGGSLVANGLRNAPKADARIAVGILPRERKSLAIGAKMPHMSTMAEGHGYSIRAEADRVRAGRYYWALFKGDQAYNRSPLSYATKREALADGGIVLEKRIAAWEAARS